MNPCSMKAVIDRKRYDTDTATLVASDAFWDGHNWERQFRNTFLYRTPRGNYFLLRMSRWEGERDHIRPVSLDEAVDLWEELVEHECSFEEAFPGVKVEDA